MIKRHFTEVKEEPSGLAGIKGCTVRWLISKDQGAQRYAMRLFTLQPDGIIPLHQHEDTEHEIFIVEGQGVLDNGREQIPVRAGDAIFVPAGEDHSFVNHTRQPMRFICVIPL
ncbi:cupin domain-containing protein [candidate division WOR-3 bacterium]|nr:cupin domain-containing protein [candidate division WOR-3 bacterium]